MKGRYIKPFLPRAPAPATMGMCEGPGEDPGWSTKLRHEGASSGADGRAVETADPDTRTQTPPTSTMKAAMCKGACSSYLHIIPLAGWVGGK